MIEAQQTGVPVKVSSVRVTYYVRYQNQKKESVMLIPFLKNYKFLTKKLENVHNQL